MTLPDERTRSLQKTREFLRSLLDPKKTPKVPKSVRQEAYSCLKHFPWDLHIDKVSKKNPDEFAPTERDEEPKNKSLVKKLKTLPLFLLIFLTSCASTQCRKVIGFIYHPETKVVEYVFPGSIAEELGIEIGEQLLSLEYHYGTDLAELKTNKRHEVIVSRCVEYKGWETR